jgi:hypothetical protein
MTRLLSAVAGALSALLGLACPLLAVSRLVLPPRVPCVPGGGQVAHVPRLPGDYTPQTGGEP